MEEDKYKAALERAKSAIKECGGNVGRIKMIESIFPELTGDMDEQSRKWILEYLYDGLRKADEQFEGQFKAAIDYLEKLKDYDKQLEEAYKTADEVQYNRGYRAAMEEMEKQDKQTADCPQNHQDVNRPNGCITMEDFSGGDGFYKLNMEYLNKRQVEEIEEIERTWNNESKTSSEVIKNCIGMCLTDVCEQRFKDYNTSLIDCLAWLEKVGKNEEIKDGNSIDPHFGKPITITKMVNDFANGDLQPSLLEIDAYRRGISDTLENQGEQSKEVTYTHEVETGNGNIKALVTEKVQLPKFKVGDFIVNDYCMGRVVEITNDAYLLDTGQGIPFSCEHNAHLWSISDAKDGDVLVCESKYGQEIGIVKQYVGKYGGCDNCFETYCFVDWDGIFRVGEYMGSKKIHPATKEQRDALMKAMTFAGYTFDFEKKELKEIEQPKLTEFEDAIKEMMDDYRDAIDDYNVTTEEVKERAAYMLSLIPQKQWKPSEEQMKALEAMITASPQSPAITSALLELHEQLKKL